MAPAPVPLPQRNRYSPALVEQICGHLSSHPVSDSQAAIACGVYPEILRYWKRAHPEIVPLLTTARAAYPPAPSPVHPARATPHATASPLAEPPPRRPRGRPSKFTQALEDALCSLILKSGVSDSRAALLLGFDANAISRWKQRNPTFAAQLHQARLAYSASRLSELQASPSPSGPTNWREARRLLARRFPADYGCPSRRAQALSPRSNCNASKSSCTAT